MGPGRAAALRARRLLPRPGLVTRERCGLPFGPRAPYCPYFSLRTYVKCPPSEAANDLCCACVSLLLLRLIAFMEIFMQKKIPASHTYLNMGLA